VVGVEGEDQIHRTSDFRVHLVFFRRHREAHVEEVRSVVEIVARIHERLADRVLVSHRGERRDLGDHADRGDLTLLRVVDVGGVMVERSHGADDAGHHGHRVRVATEATVEIVHLLMHHGVLRHQLFEFLELGCRRQFTVKQQVADFEIVRLVSQLLDGVAPIEKFALVAVNIGDGAVAGCRRGEARIVGEQTRLGVERADVDDIRTHGSAQDWKFDGLVSDDEFGDFFGH